MSSSLASTIQIFVPAPFRGHTSRSGSRKRALKGLRSSHLGRLKEYDYCDTTLDKPLPNGSGETCKPRDSTHSARRPRSREMSLRREVFVEIKQVSNQNRIMNLLMKYEIVHLKRVEVKNREIDRMEKGQALKE